GLGTDTRKPMSGQIFVALQGENHDAHQYLGDAVKQGAKCLIVHEDPQDLSSLGEQASVVRVGDTLKALQDLAKAWRKRLKAKVIGITGSAGKTTTKEFAAAILSTQFKTHRSQGSFNNHWGVPLTVLGAS